MKLKYCSHCGVEQQQDINYCSNCGIKIQTSFKRSLLYLILIENTSNKEKGIYLIWFFINCVFLIIGVSKGSNWAPESYFYPFKGGVGYYDISEFLIYAICPIAFYFSIKLIKK
jgi:hypothetical protein